MPKVKASLSLSEQAAVISNDKLMTYAYDGSKKREDKEEEEKKAAVGEDVFDALMFHFKAGVDETFYVQEALLYIIGLKLKLSFFGRS